MPAFRGPSKDFDLKAVRPPAPLRTQVRDLLRKAIVEMRFAPGERLIERELCEMTGVSRTVIREVLRELEADGLVRIVPNKGPVVAGPASVEDVRALYEARSVLEALAGRNFALYASDAEMRALRQALRRVEDVAVHAESDVRTVLAAKTEFYAILLAGARNATVEGVLRSLHDRITTLRALTVSAPGRARASTSEIRAIVDAIEARDADAAWHACLAHVQSAARVAIDLLRREKGEAPELPAGEPVPPPATPPDLRPPSAT